MEVDYYYLLGVPENASHREIRQAYRRMAEIYHPDKLSLLPEPARREGEEIMRLLNDAKAMLLDPVQRQYYDMRVGIHRPGGAEEAIILEETEEEMYESIELEPVRGKMRRVISSMKDVFSKDEEFTIKLDAAQEIIEARVIDETRPKVTVMDDDAEMVEEAGVEMRLEFSVVKSDEVEKGEEKGRAKKGFRILAVEGEEDGVEAVDVDWEEG